jgi:hypothetical protein
MQETELGQDARRPALSMPATPHRTHHRFIQAFSQVARPVPVPLLYCTCTVPVPHLALDRTRCGLSPQLLQARDVGAGEAQLPQLQQALPALVVPAL